MGELSIVITGLSEGDLHLSDGAWAVSEAIIDLIRAKTTSPDWDLYLLRNDSGFVTDNARIKKLQIMEAGNGDADIKLSLAYRDEDDSNEVHLYYVDHDGTATIDISIVGATMGGGEVSLVDNAITAAKFDELTAFPLKSADTGSTLVARTGADGDTLEDLSDQIALVDVGVSDLDTDLSFISDIEGGRWHIEGNQMVFYKPDNVTEVARFNLFDADGLPTQENVMERKRV